MPKHFDPEGFRLPVKIDSTSNGEFAPVPLDKRNRAGNRLALERASAAAKKMGVSRRRFMVSACGAAATLLALNEANALAGKTGGAFALSAEAATDPEAAAAALQGDEFIFDAQGHFVNPNGAWRDVVPDPDTKFYANPRLSAEHFIKDVFLDSDTDMMVLSFVPSKPEEEPLTIEEADAVRAIIDRMEGNHRLLIHGRVNPNQDGDLARMDELATRWKVSAFKTYTQWGPEGKGFYLTDEDTGVPFIEKARALGVPNICIHKGLAFGRQSYEHSTCSDIGPAAKMFPDVNFLVYHSGFVTDGTEGPFVPGAREDGIDSLIQSVLDSGIKPGGNVYAELGSTWRFLMRDPDAAAHAIGKLLKYVGPDNVLWGTDCIWYGSPQDQIQAFRTFQIAPELREQYGYPEITPEIRAKVFGLNAARVYGVDPADAVRGARADSLAKEKMAYAADPNPHFRTFGPKTRREFFSFLKAGGGI